LEVSPQSQLFAANIFNPNGDCPGIQDTSIQCNNSGIIWKAEIVNNTNSWWAYLSVPLTLIEPISNGTIQANFFRIDQPTQTQTREFSCYRSTFSNPPCFHRPKYFQTLQLPYHE